VDVERRAHAVPGAVAVVEALLPEGEAREGVHGGAGGAFGEHDLVVGQVVGLWVYGLWVYGVGLVVFWVGGV